jgi:hypothetical protein
VRVRHGFGCGGFSFFYNKIKSQVGLKKSRLRPISSNKIPFTVRLMGSAIALIKCFLIAVLRVQNIDAQYGDKKALKLQYRTHNINNHCHHSGAFWGHYE